MISLSVPQFNPNIFIWALPTERLPPSLVDSGDTWRIVLLSVHPSSLFCNIHTMFPMDVTFFQDPLPHRTALLPWDGIGHLLLLALTWLCMGMDSSSNKKNVKVSRGRKGKSFGIKVFSFSPLNVVQIVNQFWLLSLSVTCSPCRNPAICSTQLHLWPPGAWVLVPNSLDLI